MIIADTSGLLALYNRDEPAHEAVLGVVRSRPGPLVVSPYVVAELDYLVATRFGIAAEVAVLSELTDAAYDLAQFDARDVDAAAELIDRYAHQSIGIADASLVVLAERYGTRAVLTLDRRHFEVLRSAEGHPFEILPAR